MNIERLNGNIEAIRKYTTEHKELLGAHHFLYDLPMDKNAGAPEIVVMGINPGETAADWQSSSDPTEETRLFDFHAEETSRRTSGSTKWRKNAAYFANGKSVVFTELFFWSSRNRRELDKRFGPLWASCHLSFCIEMNRDLIEEYQPSLVIFVGISDSKIVAEKFGLIPVGAMKEGNHRLVDHYQDEARPWYFTKHWAGAWGFSDIEKEKIKRYIYQK